MTIYLQAALCHEQRETLTRSGLLGAALKHLLELSIAPSPGNALCNALCNARLLELSTAPSPGAR